MEQKRTLWIIAAVGVFLLVVIGAALILYSPTQTVEPSIASLQVQNDTWTMPGTSGLPGRDEPAPPPPPPPTTTLNNNDFQTNPQQPETQMVEGMTVYSGTTNVYGTGTTTIDLNTLKYNAPSPSSSVTAENQAAANAISSASTAKTTTNTAETTQRDSAAVSAVPTEAKATTPVASAKETTKGTSNVKTTTKATSSKPKTSTKSTSTTSSKLPDQYWVQAASFTNKANAEAARSALAENKIDSEIFTYTDSNGKVYYRLRVGPYTTKTEAEYWRSRIVLIDEFADSQSYVTNSSAKKS